MPSPEIKQIIISSGAIRQFLATARAILIKNDFQPSVGTWTAVSADIYAELQDASAAARNKFLAALASSGLSDGQAFEANAFFGRLMITMQRNLLISGNQDHFLLTNNHNFVVQN